MPAEVVYDPQAPMAFVKTSVACVREMPGHASELGTQAVAGTPVQLIDREGDWWHVLLPDGYTGYIINNGLHPITPEAFDHWRHSKRYVVTSTYTNRLIGDNGLPVTDLHNGSVLEYISSRGDSLRLRMPDNRTGWLAATDATPIDSLYPTPASYHDAVTMARLLLGVSYLWGGTTPAAMDCSGLTKIAYSAQGVILPRNASAQDRIGQQLGTDWRNFREGDLVFFESARTGNIVHVGLMMGNGRYIHCAGQVRINTLDPEAPGYAPANILHSAIRLTPATLDQLSIRNHPWYFPQ